MPIAVPKQPGTAYLSEQDYLEAEKHSEIRYEYVDGQVYAMAGASKRHGEIAVNISTAFRIAARQSPCKVYASDVKVRVAGRKTYYYPDVLVGCEPDEADDYYLEKPCLIVEVLSDSTEKRDRREKLLAYMNIPTLRAYLLVAQDKPEVELFYREPEGNWWVETFNGLEASITLPCPEATLTLADVYEGIMF
ncbi:MAG: Uma2 family endonuclease [Thiothrix sp.]